MVNKTAELLLDEAGRHINARDFGAAGVAVNCALKLDPSNVRGLSFLGVVAGEAGQKEIALNAVQHALRLAPNVAAVVNNAACVSLQCGEIGQAMELWRWLEAAQPQSIGATYHLGLSHLRMGDPDAAEVCFRRVLRLDPTSHEAYVHLGQLAKNAGRVEEALGLFREVVRRYPNDLHGHCNLIYTMHFSAEVSPEDIVSQAKEWGRSFEAARPVPEPHTNNRNPDRPLRIGYISPNFREHSVTYFILSLFRCIDRAEFQTHVYSCNVADDSVTPLLRELADSWQDVATWDDQRLTRAIREDQIDVLVDLTMHMHGERLGVFAIKPAPVQVAWCAYPSTTGLARMDFTLLDPFLYSGNPAHLSEQTHVLPGTYWCYGVYGPRPDVSIRPIDAEIVFGCLNHFGKVTSQTLDTWAEILRRIPGSKLILYMESKAAGEIVRARLVEKGLSPDRFDYQLRVDRATYLESYHHIDIALDPFPYNGATTTCDALWMGVPVVSLAGATAVSRAGLSILSNLGLRELVAESWEEYIAIAQGLAEDRSRLCELRRSLRTKMEGSVVMDAGAFGAAMGQAYREFWRQWCRRK